MAKLELYVWANCPYCNRAREVLARNGVDLKSEDYCEHDITNNEPARRALQERMGSKETVVAPQLFVNDELVGCCSDLLDLELEGKLTERLQGHIV